MDDREALDRSLKEDGSTTFFEGGPETWEEVDYIRGDDRRWSHRDSVILKSPSGRYWRVSMDIGLTEYQENSDPTIVGEVNLTETTRTVVDRKWTTVPTENPTSETETS